MVGTLAISASTSIQSCSIAVRFDRYSSELVSSRLTIGVPMPFMARHFKLRPWTFQKSPTTSGPNKRRSTSIVAALADTDWDLMTPSPRWRIRDQIAHLAFFDETATLAIDDPDAFQIHVGELAPLLAEGDGAVDGATTGYDGEPVAGRPSQQVADRPNNTGQGFWRPDKREPDRLVRPGHGRQSRF